MRHRDSDYGAQAAAPLCSWKLMVVAVVCARLSLPPPGRDVVVLLGVLSEAGVVLREYEFGILS